MKKVKKGMTLLEVVIALAIIGIMTVPLMNSLLTAVVANKKGEEVQDAKLLGQQVIEQLRLQDEVKSGTVKIGDAIITLGSLNVASGSDPYYDVTSTDVEGFTVEGKIYENDATEVISSTSGKEYLNKKLGALIVVSKEKKSEKEFVDKIYYYNRTLGDKSILEIYSNDETQILDSKLTSTANKTVELLFKDSGEVGRRSYDIYMNGKNIGVQTVGALGIYVKDETDFDFKISNKSAVSQDVVIFRDSKLSEEVGTLKGKITEEGMLNMYKNIVFDTTKRKTGLYTADLEIKKDGEKVEKIESQFYIRE